MVTFVVKPKDSVVESQRLLDLPRMLIDKAAVGEIQMDASFIGFKD